jgi:DNA-binding transcriptional LysR family regulator
MFLSRLYVRIKGELLTLRNSRSDVTKQGQAFLDRIEAMLNDKAAATPAAHEERTRTGREIEERWEQALENHRSSAETKPIHDNKETGAPPAPNPRILG